MQVTFAQGQFFHPRYGWFDEEPNLPNAAHRSGMINEPIGEEHRIKPRDPLYERINNSPAMKALMERAETRAAERAAIEAANPEPAAVYEPRDLSYYLDGTTKFAGSYQFVYKGNTVTAEVDFHPNVTDPMDVVAHYEEHRTNIQNLKNQGFHDDAVTMLMNALDEAFVNTRSGGLEGQLSYFNPGMRNDQAKYVTKRFFEEYLRIRNGAGSMGSAMLTAGNTLKSQGLMDARVDVTTSDSRKVGQPQWMADMIDSLDAAWAASPANQPISDKIDITRLYPVITRFGTMTHEEYKKTKGAAWDVADTHIRNINRMVDFSHNATMSDMEKEARSLSIVFRVRGNQMIDYAKRYEEIMGQLESKLENEEISGVEYNRYRTDLDTAFIKTHNLNVKGQAMEAGLSEQKAMELAVAFSEAYIKIRSQTAPGEMDAGKIANTALQRLTSQGWPQFSLYSSENRATVSGDDSWYAMISEDALYWQKVPQPYAHW